MAFNRAQFLIEILGADAACALAKAASRSEYLAQMIVPRTILAMLEAVPAFEGSVPGFDDCSLKYTKSEKGFTGSVALGEDMYKFEGVAIFHVAGALSTAMGLDSLMFNSGRNTELQRLGKSIDLMAKAHLVAEESKTDEELSDEEFERKYDVDRSDMKPGEKHGPKLKKKAMGEGTGKTAGPVAPAAPTAPTANAAAPTTQQKLPKAAASAGAKPPKPVTSSTTVKLTRSEQNRACPVCARKQFVENSFVGCMCFSALAKSVDVVDRTGYIELRFGEDWDRETVVTFLEAVGRS